MLINLAMLSNKHQAKSQLLAVSLQMLEISSFRTLYIERYFRTIDYLACFDDFARVEDFLELIEAWPKEKFIEEKQRIHRG